MDSDWREFDSPDWHTTIREDCLPLRIVEIPPPCVTCGGIVFWWDGLDRARCDRCDPPPRPGVGAKFPRRERRVEPKAVPVKQSLVWPPTVYQETLESKPEICCCGGAIESGQPGRRDSLCFACWCRLHCCDALTLRRLEDNRTG